MSVIEPLADDGIYSSIFERPWWLEAVAPGAWGSVTVRRKGAIVARLPYVLGRRLGRAVIVQPPLTQTLGPWLRPIEGKPDRRVSAEIDLLGELIDGLPAVSLMTQHLSPTLTNWLPFHWRGYSATSRITYRLDDVSDLDAIWGGLKSTARAQVRRAAERFTVSTDSDIGDLIALNQRTFRRQGLAQPYEDDLVRRLDAALVERDARRLLVAVDRDGRPQATNYIAWGDGCAHGLAAGQSDEARGSGAASLLMWEAIRFASSVGVAFDFGGSMLPSIEQFIRSFGGRQLPYLAVTRASRSFARLKAARSLVNPSGGVG